MIAAPAGAVAIDGGDDDALPVVILSDRQAVALAAFLAGIADARAGLPALVDPRHAPQRGAWFDGWWHGQVANQAAVVRHRRAAEAHP
jgi:hypothetical protein